MAGNNKSTSAKRLAEWDKAEKERSPKNGEIVRDKFPQAFKGAVEARAEALENRHKAELRLKLALEQIEQCRTAREAMERASGK